MNARVKDMTGMRFASLLAVRPVGRASSGDLKWEFLCDCGTSFEANGYYARCGKISTCPSCSANRSRLASVIHGKTETREFEVWVGMHTRCNNPNAKAFPSYGGRGVSICARWRESFENFLADMGPCPSPEHSIERQDNDGNYEPDNCHWATRVEQANNKRSNVKVTIDGITKTLAQWASESGLSYQTIWQRHRNGKRPAELTVAREHLLRQKRKGAVEFNGCTDTYAGWSRRTGIKPSTIAMRIHKYGWSIEKALTEGARF